MWHTQLRVWISRQRKMWSKKQSLQGTESCASIHPLFFLFFWHMDHIQEPVFVHFTNPKSIFLTSCSFHAITPDLYEGAN